jgi:hypothetical protein
MHLRWFKLFNNITIEFMLSVVRKIKELLLSCKHIILPSEWMIN